MPIIIILSIIIGNNILIFVEIFKMITSTLHLHLATKIGMTYLNTFDQSWEEHFDYSCDFRGTNPFYGYPSVVPNYLPENYFEPELSHFFETVSQIKLI